MNTYKALVKREILDGKNGYLRVPVILAGITVVLFILSVLGFGKMEIFDGMQEKGFSNLGEVLTHLESKGGAEKTTGVTIGYWATTILPFVALPFVVFFSLLGSLYEERRDRSILFWKSMPVADWQEVAVKLFVPVVVAPVLFLAVVIASQLIIAVFLSVISIFQGGPLLILWPLGYMFASWFAAISMYFIQALWLLPILAWVLLVSSFANRMPFVWAVLAPAVLVVTEKLFFDTHIVGSWIGIHMGGWAEGALGHNMHHFESAAEVFRYLMGGPQLEAITYSLASLHFYAGLVVAGGLTYAAIEQRKRAS